jgi:hypothetical protein
MDQAMRTAVKIEQEMLRNIDAAYHGILAPVLRKHRQTLDRLDKLMQAGAMARARVLWRKSGIIEDLAAAIAGAGQVSADAIRAGLTQIREAAADAKS